jgi:hypothetical protein
VLEWIDKNLLGSHFAKEKRAKQVKSEKEAACAEALTMLEDIDRFIKLAEPKINLPLGYRFEGRKLWNTALYGARHQGKSGMAWYTDEHLLVFLKDVEDGHFDEILALSTAWHEARREAEGVQICFTNEAQAKARAEAKKKAAALINQRLQAKNKQKNPENLLQASEAPTDQLLRPHGPQKE